MAEALDPPFNRPDRGFNDLPGWTWVGTYGGYYLQADRLGEFEHGFFTRQWQGRGPEELAGAISAGITVHRPRQIHSANVLPASEARGEPWPEADGLVSDGAGQSLWVCGADCTPVLIADPATGRVGACHAGWRGVAGRILPGALTLMEMAGSRRADLLVALGPAVSGASYQVQRPVSLEVAQSLRPEGGGDADAALEDLRACGALLEDSDPGHDRLDIRAAARAQLIHAGVDPARIEVCPLCTVEESLLFHSWRRDRIKAVQWSGIVSQC
jgi:YfiH family protein